MQLKNKLRKIKNIDKIIISKIKIKKAKEIIFKTKKTEIKIKIIEINIEIDAKTSAKVTAIVATTTIDRKYLLKLYK